MLCKKAVSTRTVARKAAHGKHAKTTFTPAKRACTLALAVVTACSLSFPSLAFASVIVDETELAQGENAIGGGTATLSDTSLDMNGVTADTLYTDESLTMNFNGGNEVGNVEVADSAAVSMNFCGSNEVEEVHAHNNANVTINANGNNEFEEIEAFEQADVTINVTGQNDFEEIVGYDDASITIRGTSCQRKDIVNLGAGENDTQLFTTNGNLTIDHVTVNLEGEIAVVGSENGNVNIDTSKIAQGDDNEYADVTAGGTMQIRESVVDITGTVHSDDQMTIDHSDVKVEEPNSKYGDKSPYRVYSKTGIDLINEKNGEVEKGELDGKKVWYVDTDDNDGEEVDLKADGEPAYYRCASDKPALRAMPQTNDGTNPFWPLAAGIASAMTAAYAARRREEQ